MWAPGATDKEEPKGTEVPRSDPGTRLWEGPIHIFTFCGILISESYLLGCNVIDHSSAIYAKTSTLSSQFSRFWPKCCIVGWYLNFFYFMKLSKYGNLDFKMKLKGIWITKGNKGKLAVLHSHFFARQRSSKNPTNFYLQNSLGFRIHFKPSGIRVLGGFPFVLICKIIDIYPRNCWSGINC